MPAALRNGWRRLRAFLRPPRRLRLLRPGGLLIGGIFGLGFATLNTGNNLLYLLLGALLGLIALSGMLSEQTLRGIRIERRIPRAVTAGEPMRIAYVVSNTKLRLPSFVLELRERGYDARTGVPYVGPDADATARATLTFPRRGEYQLDGIVLATTFPFGFFLKERDIERRDRVLVWPRTTRKVRTVRGVGRTTTTAAMPAAAVGIAERAEYRGLRPYRAGDDPRDVHWRTTARAGEPIVREFDREQGRHYWIVLDTTAPAGDAAEVAVEMAAALAAQAHARGDRFGIACGRQRLEPGSGAAQLDRTLDVLARARFGEAALNLPAAPAQCVLVTVSGAAGAFADVLLAPAA